MATTVVGCVLDFRICARALVLCQIFLLCGCVSSEQNAHPVDTGPRSSDLGLGWSSGSGTVSRIVDFLIDVPDACRENRTYLVIVVCSAFDHFTQRDVIRRTWGSIVQSQPDVKLLFLLGRHPHPVNATSTPTSPTVQNEASQFGDVIQADFIDSYANLTVKSIVMLHWMTSHCACARFLLKADDDSFVNSPLLLRGLRNSVHRRFIMGSVIARAQPVRQPDAKWYTPNSVFNRTAYPSYVSGAAYVISGDVIGDLYRATDDTPLFWIEDVYVTGLLARRVGVQLVVNVKFDGYKELLDRCSIRKHIVQHHVVPRDFERLWLDVINADENCSSISNK